MYPTRTLIKALATGLAFLCVAVFALESLDDVQVGGKYRMQLTTGDRLEGTVEFKDDTSLILETPDGPFSFRGTLILELELLVAAPPSREDLAKGEGARTFTYGELLARGPSEQTLEVRIKNGSTFVGKVAAIDRENLRLNVQGAMIPIGQNMISSIMMVVEETVVKEEPEEEIPQGPFDTVHVVNPNTDEYGNPLAPLIIVGKIRQQNDRGLTIVTPRGVARTLTPDKIARVIRHTASDYEGEIKRYAKPLFCDEGMILIDLPPGKEGRPFFKVCIDKYEYPNQPGTDPRGNVSYDDAQKLCAALGKRLCSVTEWQWACSGLEGYTYPYGWHFEKDRCNTEGVNSFEPSGVRRNCRGKFGVYDMVGNIFEWTAGPDGKPMLMGGPYSKCQTASPGVGGAAKPQTGLRCCKSN